MAMNILCVILESSMKLKKIIINIESFDFDEGFSLA